MLVEEVDSVGKPHYFLRCGFLRWHQMLTFKHLSLKCMNLHVSVWVDRSRQVGKAKQACWPVSDMKGRNLYCLTDVSATHTNLQSVRRAVARQL